MIAYSFAGLACGSCGHGLLNVDKAPFNPMATKGVAQVICAHRECADYDKPMECDLPQITLRPTTNEEILREVAKEPSRLMVVKH